MVTKNPPVAPVLPATRERITIDVPPDLMLLLDYIAGPTGMSRNAVVLMILGNGAVEFIDKARELKTRAKEIGNQVRR